MQQASPAAVDMFAAPGKISDVPLCVSVNALENTSHFLTPAATAPKAVIVVVPVTVITPSRSVDRSVVDAEAMLLLAAESARMADWIAH